MNEILGKFDREALLRIVLEEKEYEDLVSLGNGNINLLNNPVYQKYDEKLKDNFDEVIATGIKVDFWEQTKSSDSFRHMAINRKFNEENKLRLYLCPKDEFLYFIVNELLKRCSKTGEPIYLKYSRENRYDKIVMFLKNSEDLYSKLSLLEKIKSENPIWFSDMKKADTWLSESSFKGAFITPEKITKRDINSEYASYTMAVIALMSNVKKELMFHFKVLDSKMLKNVQHDELMKVFCYYFLRELGKMGLFIYFDDKNKLEIYTNSLFPGFGESVDEDIRITKDGLEVGKRIDEKNKKYFKIPFGKSIPMTPDEYQKYDSYIMDDITAMNMLLYPESYSDQTFPNQGGEIINRKD